MSPTDLARAALDHAALDHAGIPAPTDRQVEQVVSRAAHHRLDGRHNPYQTAADQVAEESR